MSQQEQSGASQPQDSVTGEQPSPRDQPARRRARAVRTPEERAAREGERRVVPGRFRFTDLRQAQVVRHVLSNPASQRELIHKELVYLHRRLKAYRSLRLELKRVGRDNIAQYADQRNYNQPTSVFADTLAIPLQSLPDPGVLRGMWPDPFIHLEEQWDLIYISEFPEVMVLRDTTSPLWLDFLTPYSRHFLACPTEAIAALRNWEPISYECNFRSSMSPLDVILHALEIMHGWRDHSNITSREVSPPAVPSGPPTRPPSPPRNVPPPSPPHTRGREQQRQALPQVRSLTAVGFLERRAHDIATLQLAAQERLREAQVDDRAARRWARSVEARILRCREELEYLGRQEPSVQGAESEKPQETTGQGQQPQEHRHTREELARIVRQVLNRDDQPSPSPAIRPRRARIASASSHSSRSSKSSVSISTSPAGAQQQPEAVQTGSSASAVATPRVVTRPARELSRTGTPQPSAPAPPLPPRAPPASPKLTASRPSREPRGRSREVSREKAVREHRREQRTGESQEREKRRRHEHDIDTRQRSGREEVVRSTPLTPQSDTTKEREAQLPAAQQVSPQVSSDKSGGGSGSAQQHEGQEKRGQQAGDQQTDKQQVEGQQHDRAEGGENQGEVAVVPEAAERARRRRRRLRRLVVYRTTSDEESSDVAQQGPYV
ncbi:hypothetical protein Emed_006516 [Eimeria media]